MIRHSGVVLALAILVSCDRSPTAPTPTLQYLSISPALDAVVVGRPVAFSTFGIYSDGTSKVVSATLSADPSLATISSGVVTATRVGRFSLIATADGQTVTRALRALVDYSGQWGGPISVTNCTALDPRKCQARTPEGMSLFVDQTEIRVRAYIVINGTVILHVFLDGSVSDTGELMLSGERVLTTGGPPYGIMRVSDWRTNLLPDGTMSGTFIGAREENYGSTNPTQRVTYALGAVQRTQSVPMVFPM